MNPYLKALEERLSRGEIMQEQYNHLADLLSDETNEPEQPIPEPNITERLVALESVVIDLLLF